MKFNFGNTAAQQWDDGASADGTVEGWFNADTFGYDVMARSYNNGKWMLLMNTSTLDFMVTDNANTTTTPFSYSRSFNRHSISRSWGV